MNHKVTDSLVKLKSNIIKSNRNKILSIISILILSSTLVLFDPLPKTNAATGTGVSVQIDHSNDYISQNNADGSTSLVPYILSQTPNTITVQTRQGSFVYNNSTCNFAFYNSTSVSGTPIIPFDSYTVKAESSSATTWTPVSLINNAACSTKIFADGTNITLQSTRSVPGTGVFQINYTKHPDMGLKLTFKATNLNPLWTNYHLGITETIAVPTHLTLGNTAYDLSQYNNTLFSRASIQSIHSQIITFDKKLWYDMGLGWNNTSDYTVSYKNNQANLSIDYTHNTPALQPNQSFIVDPSITKDTSSVTTFNGGGSSFTSSSFLIGSNSNRLLIVGVSVYKSGGTPVDFSSVKLDGNSSLTQLSGTDIVSTGTNNDRVAVYFLINPPTGTHTITITAVSSVDDAGIGWLSVYNADQGAGMENGNSAKGTSGTMSLTITPTHTGSWDFVHTASTSGSINSCSSVSDWYNTVNAILGGGHNTSPNIGSGNTETCGNSNSEFAIAGGEVCVYGSSCSSGGGGGSNPITEDTSGVTTFSGGFTSKTSANFTIGSNTNRLLVAGVSAYCSLSTCPDFSSVKLDGSTTMTQLSGTDVHSGNVNAGDERTAVYYLIAPPTGSHNIVMTMAGSVTDGGIGWLSVYNANQATGMQSGNGNSGNGGTLSLTITPADSGSWAFAHFSGTAGGSSQSMPIIDWSNTINAILGGGHDTAPTIGSGNTYSGSGGNSGGNTWATSGGEICVYGGACTNLNISVGSVSNGAFTQTYLNSKGT